MAEEPLSEKDFIQERYKKDPWGLWGTFAFTMLVAALIWGISSWKDSYIARKVTDSPFHQVSNREISLFLYQNPEYMRVHRRSKNGYLPGFDYEQRVGIKLGRGDSVVQAPPSLLFRYHTWHRLLGAHIPEVAISPVEFEDFLVSAPEWRPQYWEAAPEDYKHLMAHLESREEGDLYPELPPMVRQAFLGWKNYFKEGEAISELEVTAGEMREFLASYQHFRRNYWRNLYLNEDYTSPYLASLASLEDSDVVPDEELPSFLRAAVFNARRQ